MQPGMLAVALLGALLPWRDDGRCGEHFPAPDGTRVSRCDPWDADAPCCSAEGVCGVGDEFCQCDGCIDYSIRQDWRSDGQCGPEVTGADGSSPATCHPLDRNNGTCCSRAMGPDHQFGAPSVMTLIKMSSPAGRPAPVAPPSWLVRSRSVDIAPIC